MFICNGCQQQTRDKDLGAILRYETSQRKVELPFCYPVNDDCGGPTVYFMLQTLTPEQRRAATKVTLNLDFDVFTLQPATVHEWTTLDDLFQEMQRVYIDRPLETTPHLLPLDFYQRRGEQLAQQFGGTEP